MENYLKFLVEDNPDESYRFYKYLLPDSYVSLDVTLAPKSINYNISVDPKLQKKEETIDGQGSLVFADWWAFENKGTLPVEQVLKVDISYVYDPADTDFNTAKTVLEREVRRQWILENGTYKTWTEEEIQSGESDVKITNKVYPDYRSRKLVGQRRRANVMAIGEERFITLVTILIAQGNQEKAQRLGLAILRKYAAEYNEFWNTGDGAFMQGILDESSTDTLLAVDGNPIIDGVSANSLLNQIIPPHPFTVNIGYGDQRFNEIVPGSEGLTIRQFMDQKYKGNI